MRAKELFFASKMAQKGIQTFYQKLQHLLGLVEMLVGIEQKNR